MSENIGDTMESIELPLLPLRDVVVYPHMVIPLFVGRERSIEALEEAMANDKQILLVAQKNASIDDPGEEDIYRVGTVSTVLQLLKLPDGTVKVLVEGGYRAKLEAVNATESFYTAVTIADEPEALSEADADALVQATMGQFDKYVNLSKKVPSEVLNSVSGIDEPGRLADTIAAHMSLDLEQKQAILEVSDVQGRIDHLMGLMEAEIDLFQVEKRIRGRVKKQMEKSQREYYLNEQMKAIQKELGDMDEAPNELEDLQNKIKESGMSKEAEEKASAELNKLKMMSPMSAEASVVRSYIDWMVNVPWKKRSKVKHDLKRASKILEDDHYGLEEVKERILEYLAVQKRVKKIKGPVLCLVGPPGVGKTSLGESIARSTNRKFVRMALGGVRDEAEIRGHRRTYIGSMPGKILQKLSKVEVKNPLFLLDEIDKMGMDNRGDPASALLEVLDPEQNNSFNDHYLEVDYDLSDVMFICTSNSMNIPAPLLDRMEVIRIPGYTEDEKVNIAQRYLKPKAMKNNGVKESELTITEDAIRDLVRYYTREAGVRSLEREVAKLCRKVVKEFSLAEKEAPITITPDDLEHYSGVRKFSYGKAEDDNQIGQVTGLAWTQVGGELLTIEAVSVAGKGRQVKTGSLGDVMQESIQAATTVVRSRSQLLGIPAKYHDEHDLHIHVPEGATPKDGPSAGIGMCTALVSVLTGIPVNSDVAMTGEITLRGQVLPIGGLKEKLLAAHRGGIKTVIIPDENSRDLKEIPDNIKADLVIKPVKWIDEVLEVALETMPKPLSDDEFLSKSEDNPAAIKEKPKKGGKTQAKAH
ncbi:endopeptidase La [Oceanicoccus sagamiensis]|uniref:Lon protease n=1 Tax=Oceanicoccus sagamiensis TaxID=716816 RepID=A0A1X9NJ92_9GAMM|nr:endopeptidase La [Oceanicoccus sagamiensis]ARN75549.1 endopeptidase La [Oceanicoccus sagamiensis]